MKAHRGSSVSSASRVAVRISVLFVVSSSAARASQNYPEVIQKELQLPAPPQCTLCHDTNKGGANTVHKPFGVWMRQLNARGKGDVGSLRVALRQLGDHDSDGDTVSDVDELVEGRDPNVPQGIGDAAPPALPELPPPLETGCAVRSTRSRSGSGMVACSLLALAAWRRGRARPRSNASSCLS